MDLRRYSVFKGKAHCDWEKTMKQETLKRHEWLAKVWIEIYFNSNMKDEFIRNLTTEDMIYTKWYEKYGYKEPKF